MIVLRNYLKLSEPHAGSMSSSGSEFQTVVPEIENTRQPYVFESTAKTARYDELVSVCRKHTKPRSDIRCCDEMVGEVLRCLTVKTATVYIIMPSQWSSSRRSDVQREPFFIGWVRIEALKTMQVLPLPSRLEIQGEHRKLPQRG